MASSRYRRVLLLVGWGLALRASVACDESRPDTELTAPQLLDRLCRAPSTDCRLTGSARLVSGLTADTIGVQIGPDPGTLEILWPPSSEQLSSTQGESSLRPLFQVMARGKGALSSAPGAPTLREKFDWYEAPEQPTYQEPRAFIRIAESTSGQTIDVVDLRESSPITYDCSVAHVGVHRR